MKTVRFSRIARALLFLPLAFPLAQAQNFPLSPNSWNNPDFQERFLGSFGFRSDVEPGALSREEARAFNDNIIPAAREGRMQDAINLLRPMVTQESNAHLDFTLATLYLQTGNNREAIRFYESAIRKFPSFLRAYRNLGFVLTQEGEHRRAVEMIAKALELGEAGGDTFGLLGFNHFSLGNFSAALDAYRLAAALNPGNRDWKVGKARALMETRRFEEAIAAVDELLSVDPNDSRFWVTRANAFVGLQDLSSAAANLEVVRRMGVANVSSLQLLGDIYTNKGLPRLALAVYGEAVSQIAPERALRIARTFTERRYFDEARSFLEKFRDARREIPETIELGLLNVESQIALGQGDREHAASVLEQILTRDPMNGSAHLSLAHFYQGEGDTELADFHFLRAQTVGDSDTQFAAFVSQAEAKVRARDFEAAVPLLRQALLIRNERRIADYLEAVENVIRRT